MRHCDQLTLDQLLSLRDAQLLEASLMLHATECPQCQSEVARLRSRREALQALPELAAPALVFSKAPARLGKRPMALVAGLGALLVASAVWISTQSQSPQPVLVQRDEPATAPSDEPNIGSLVQYSQQLEAMLAMLPSGSIERAGTATTIDELQAQIQWVDFQLSVASEVGLSERQATELWQDRVGLLDALVKVRYADTQRMAML